MTNNKNKEERVIIFIDWSNHYHIVKDMFKDRKSMNFNFERFITSLAGNRKLVRTYYYTAPLDWKKDE